MDPYSKHAQGLQAFQSYLGQACPVFTWNKLNFQIIPGTARTRKDMKEGGFRLDADLRFTCLVSQFTQQTGQPALKQEIIYLGHTYRIEEIATLTGGQVLQFDCNDAQQGA